MSSDFQDMADLPIVAEGRLVRTARIPEDREHFFDIDQPQAVIQHLMRLRPRADLFTFWQRLPEVEPRFSFYLEWDNVAAIPISTYEHWLRNQIHQNTRNKVRKAAKRGVVVRVSDFSEDFIKGIVKIFAEVPIRQGRPFAHYGEDFEKVREEWSEDLDKSIFLGAYYEGDLIGFIKLLDAGRYFRTSGTLAMVDHRDKAPMNALIAQAVRVCEESHRPFLIYGKYIYGKKGQDSLTDFKRYNGFEMYRVPRYFVPLTILGSLALKSGLHKGVLETLPTGILQTFIRLRNRLYSMRDN